MINWQVFQENLILLGIQGSGKSTKAKGFLDSIPNVPRLIISPQNPVGNYGLYGEPIYTLDEIQNGRAMLWLGDFSKDTIDRISKTVMERCHNMVFMVDDVHEYCTKQRIPPNFNTLIQSGRNRGICGIYLSPAPNLVHNYILQSGHHIIAFRMNLYNQIEWLESNYFGERAQILIPAELRKSKTPMEYDTLPKYAFLYRYYMSTESELFVPDAKGAPAKNEAE